MASGITIQAMQINDKEDTTKRPEYYGVLDGGLENTYMEDVCRNCQQNYRQTTRWKRIAHDAQNKYDDLLKYMREVLVETHEKHIKYVTFKEREPTWWGYTSKLWIKAVDEKRYDICQMILEDAVSWDYIATASQLEDELRVLRKENPIEHDPTP